MDESSKSQQLNQSIFTKVSVPNGNIITGDIHQYQYIFEGEASPQLLDFLRDKQISSEAHTKDLPSRLPDSLRLTRDEELKNIKDLIFSEPISCLGIWGMTGVGKSTLALDLEKDIDVNTAFFDEVFWLTIGRQPSLVDKQLQLARELGYKSSSFISEDEGKSCLLNLLSNRSCLLILDDIWDANHVILFKDILGVNSKILFTTQYASIITSLGAEEYQLEELNIVQAESLLAKWAGDEYSPINLPTEAKEVIKKCGKLPLALSLCGAMIRDRVSWTDLLEALQNVKLELIENQFSPYYPEPNLLKALKVSIDALANKETLSQQRYFELVVFPPDEEILEEVIFLLWKQTANIDKLQGKTILSKLERRALLKRNNGKVSLHTLQYAYLKAINIDVQSLHNKLIESYQQIYPKGWHTAKSDGYFFEHLAYHLIESGRKEDLYQLLTQSQDWMNVKFQNCMGDSAYLSDIQLALDSMHDPLSPQETLVLVQLQTAYRVVNQRSDRYSSGYYAPALIWLGRKDEVLGYARLYSDTGRKFATLANTYKTMCEKGEIDLDLLYEVWQAAREIEDIQHRVGALGLVASELYKSQNDDFDNAFIEAINWAEQIDNKQNKTHSYISLASNLCQINLRERAVEIYTQAKETALSMDDHQQNTIIPQELYKSEIEDLQWKIILLCDIVNSLWQEKFQEEAINTLEEAIKLSDESQVIIDGLQNYLIDNKYLKEIDYADLFNILQNPSLFTKEELELAQIQMSTKFNLASIENFIEINSHTQQSVKLHLCQSLALMNEFDTAKSKNIIEEINDEWFKNSALMTLVLNLVRDKRFIEAKVMVQLSTQISQKINLLCIIAEAISQEESIGEDLQSKTIFTEVANLIDTEIINRDEKDLSLYFLSTYLARSNSNFLEQAETYALKIVDISQQSSALVEIARALSVSKQFGKAETTIEKIKDSQQKADSLAQLVITLVKANRETQALSIFEKSRNLSIESNNFLNISATLRCVAIWLSKHGYNQQSKFAFNKVQLLLSDIRDTETFNIASFWLALSLIKAGLFDEAEEVAQKFKITDEYNRKSEFLYQLSSSLIELGDLDRASEVIKQIENKQLQVKAKCQIYEYLSLQGLEKDAKQVYIEIENITHEITESYAISNAMKDIALTEAKLEKYDNAQDISQHILENNIRMECLYELTKILVKSEDFDRAKNVVWEIETDYLRASALCDVALKESLSQCSNVDSTFSIAKKEAENVKSDWGKAKSLCELASAMYRTGRHADAENIFRQAEKIARETLYCFNHPQKKQIRDSRQAEVFQWLSNSKAEANLYKDAFEVFNFPEFSKSYNFYGLEQFIINIVNWSDTFEQVESELSRKVLFESMRIAGWIYPTWREIYRLIL
ncbi:MAG: NB-ARC domain-containing protein [Pseudanabaenaceae cyanobacterium bins.39]|nr:NB-ARC domain-containing protein [Pseudanabaenaceae cyanobacterium bins.39]